MSLVTEANRDLVLGAGYLAVFAAVYLVSRMLLSEGEERHWGKSCRRSESEIFLRNLSSLTRPFFTQYVVPMVRGKKMWDSHRIAYRRRLISAGLKDELTPDEFIAYKFFLVAFSRRGNAPECTRDAKI